MTPSNGHEGAQLGAGEILLTSMDRDGTKAGFDLALTRAVAGCGRYSGDRSGGVGNLDHLADGVSEGHADAVLAASIFHFGEYTVRQAKERMRGAASRCACERHGRRLPWLDALKWDGDGMIPAIAQDAETGRVLMFAWMNREANHWETSKTGNAVLWSRSRGRLWRKGEESGHYQKVKSIRTDCDGDVLLLAIEQGRHRLPYRPCRVASSTNCRASAGRPSIRF